MNKLKRNIFKVLAIIMLLNAILPTAIVFAQVEDSNAVIKGDYQYSASEGNNIQNQNTFYYRDDCFTRSSFLGCKHLEMLSIQAAASSISWYGEELDGLEISANENGHNLVNLLEAIAFEDVETNTYYNTEKKENSVGVAVGHKTIIQEGQPYTLLAVIPRSAGYKQEWVGNFTIGDGDIHEGFKAARDEILRFVKQYIQNYEIEGSLKVWIAGYSRGAAISDMVAGFFAGGGIEYFGDGVSITPEDVYCYTIGTPSAIKDGLSKNVELSVSANREEPAYANDTPGEAFEYTKGGTVEVGDQIYNGLRNLISPLDSFPLLPPSEWGFTHYGVTINPNENISSAEEMLEELKSISKYQYERYTEDGKLKPFKYKTLDVKTLSIVDDEGEIAPSDFINQRLHAISNKIKSNAEYVDENYQEALKSFGGVIGMMMVFLMGDQSTIDVDTSDAVEALVFTCLSYMVDCIMQEGKADNEMDAAVLALSDLLSFILEKDIDIDTLTIDEFVEMLTEFISENEVVENAVVSLMVNNIPEDYAGLIPQFFGLFYTGDEEEAELGDYIKAFLKACYLGPDPESEAYESITTSAEARSMLYTILYVVLGSSVPEAIPLLVDGDFNFTASGLLSKFIEIMLKMMMTEKDDEGTILKEYNSFSEFADEKLKELFALITEEPIEASESLYGVDYRNDLQRHVDGIQTYMSEVREIISTFLLYPGEEFSAEGTIRSAVTFIDNAMQIPIEHFDEIYLAKARTADRYEPHVFYTVTFKLNNGTSDESGETIEVAEEEIIEKPSNPKRTGYRFGGWYVDEKLTSKFAFDTPIIDDTVIYAKWTRNSSGSSSSSSAGSSTKKNTSGETISKTNEEPISQETNKQTEPELGQEEVWTSADDWAVEELQEANKKGVIPSSLKKKDFTKKITRKEFAAVAVRLYEVVSGKQIEIVSDNPFIDTDDEEVLKAYSIGITMGTSETTFSPDDEVTREQMATMLTRGLSKAGIDVSIDLQNVSTFEDDGLISDWGRESVYYMAEKGIILGIGDNQFNGLGNAKIEEAILIVLRSIEVLGK